MRILRKIIDSNWKYVLTELVLIFVGIYLALSLNNWNESKKIKREKESVVNKLEEEITKNLEILRNAEDQNVKFFEGFERYAQLSGNDDREIVASESQFEQFEQDFPNFFTLSGKAPEDATRYRYKLSLQIKFRSTDLRDIAWSTAKTAGFSSEFSYACMLDIEDVYRAQERYMAEMGKIFPFLIENQYSRLPVTCMLLKQFQASLQDDYESLLERIRSCQ